MSMFTRRHYVWLASVMRDITTHPPLAIQPDNAREIVELFADALKDESPDGFKRQRFIDAIYNINTNADVQ